MKKIVTIAFVFLLVAVSCQAAPTPIVVDVVATPRPTAPAAATPKETGTPTLTSQEQATKTASAEYWQMLEARVATEAVPRPPGPTPALLTVKVLSWNILLGAGVDAAYDRLLTDDFKKYRNRDRFPAFLSIVKDAAPDILAIQEASGWHQGVGSQVAEQLHMNYFQPGEYNAYPVAIFTKFRILDAEDLHIGSPGGLRVSLVTDTGQVLHVFVAHLGWPPSSYSYDQLFRIVSIMKKYAHDRVMLVGHLNFTVPSAYSDLLEESKFQLVLQEKREGFDQIWLSTPGRWSQKQWFQPPSGWAQLNISDHLLIAAEITMTPQK